LKYYLPAVAWAIFILVVSTKVGVQIKTDFWGVLSPDKLAHAFVYALLCYLILYGLYKKKRLTNATKLLAFLLCSLYGLALEFVQFAFFPDRFFEWEDELANVIGTIFGLIIFKHYKLF
jgi:VanZ family protein